MSSLWTMFSNSLRSVLVNLAQIASASSRFMPSSLLGRSVSERGKIKRMNI